MEIFLCTLLRKRKKCEQGNAALIFLLAITSLTLLIALSIASITLINQRNTLGYMMSKEAYMLSDGCMEYVLLRIQKDPAYAPSSVTIPSGTCTVSITANGDNRTIVITSQKNNYYRSIQVDINITNYLVTLLEWKEL